MSDNLVRSIVKTVTWRIIGSGSTFLIVYVATGQLYASTGIALAQLISNSILYWVHERIWNRTSWGKLD